MKTPLLAILSLFGMIQTAFAEQELRTRTITLSNGQAASIGYIYQKGTGQGEDWDAFTQLFDTGITIQRKIQGRQDLRSSENFVAVLNATVYEFANNGEVKTVKSETKEVEFVCVNVNLVRTCAAQLGSLEAGSAVGENGVRKLATNHVTLISSQDRVVFEGRPLE